MAEIYDYIIVGSGFGGSVSAMRLAEKGYKLAVLEKGREFKTADFPKTNWNVAKYLWAPWLKCFGFQNITWFKEVMVLSGTGVGGGSLVYANTLMTPPDQYFNNPVWRDFNNWKEVLAPYYTKAKFMLGAVENPWEHKADQVLKEVAADMGQVSSAENVKVGVYFGDENREVDPYFKGHGPLRRGCNGCAGCMVGCRYNAKNTLDKNYLYFARKFGAKIFAKTMVEKVDFRDGLYHFQTFETGAWFFKRKRTFQARGVIFAAGVLGTMKLLLKQKYSYGTLPQISHRLGENIRTNSEMLVGTTAKEAKLNHGVAISSIMNPDDDTHVEICKYPTGSNFMKFFTLPYVSYSKTPKRLLRSLSRILLHPWRSLKLYFFTEWAENTVIFLIMQHLDSAMTMKIKRWPWRRLSLKNNSKRPVPAYIPAGAEVLDRFAKKVDGLKQASIPEIAFDKPATAHILGGAPMGKNDDEGVVDANFKLHNYPNAYVLDGSIVQCNLGVNPSLSITALAEYAMAQIPKKPGSEYFSLDELLDQTVDRL